LLYATIVEGFELVWVCCGWPPTAHSNSSTIVADSNNGVTNTRYCRYSLRFVSPCIIVQFK
jgi:hypothetical protein